MKRIGLFFIFFIEGSKNDKGDCQWNKNGDHHFIKIDILQNFHLFLFFLFYFKSYASEEIGD